MIDIIPAEGEDEPWSPTSIVFALTAATFAQIDSTSLVCDLAAGGAVSSIAIARRTHAHIHAVDSSSVAIASIVSRCQQYHVSEFVSPIQMDAVEYLDHALEEGLKFDLVLAEGGIGGVVGHQLLLNKIRGMLKPAGVLIMSGFAYNGVTEQPALTNRITTPAPEDVREHYENTMYSATRRDIPDEQQLLKLIEACGFNLCINFRSGQNHWSAYFERMQRMAVQGVDVACQHHSAARRFGIGEAYHNLRGQFYLCYAVLIAQSRTTVEPQTKQLASENS